MMSMLLWSNRMERHIESLHQGSDISLNLGLLARFTSPCSTTNLLANGMPNI